MCLENPWILESFSFFKGLKDLKFFCIHFGLWKSLNFNWGTFLNLQKNLQILVWSQQNKICIEETKVRYGLTYEFSKWLPQRAKADYYQNIFIVYLECVLKVINYVFEILNCSPWKSLKSPWILYGNKCANPEFII